MINQQDNQMPQGEKDIILSQIKDLEKQERERQVGTAGLDGNASLAQMFNFSVGKKVKKAEQTNSLADAPVVPQLESIADLRMQPTAEELKLPDVGQIAVSQPQESASHTVEMESPAISAGMVAKGLEEPAGSIAPPAQDYFEMTLQTEDASDDGIGSLESFELNGDMSTDNEETLESLMQSVIESTEDSGEAEPEYTVIEDTQEEFEASSEVEVESVIHPEEDAIDTTIEEDTPTLEEDLSTLAEFMSAQEIENKEDMVDYDALEIESSHTEYSLLQELELLDMPSLDFGFQVGEMHADDVQEEQQRSAEEQPAETPLDMHDFEEVLEDAYCEPVQKETVLYLEEAFVGPLIRFTYDMPVTTFMTEVQSEPKALEIEGYTYINKPASDILFQKAKGADAIEDMETAAHAYELLCKYSLHGDYVDEANARLIELEKLAFQRKIEARALAMLDKEKNLLNALKQI